MTSVIPQTAPDAPIGKPPPSDDEAPRPSVPDELVRPEVHWEVWQDDMMVAAADTEQEGRHYLLVYSQDGPAKLLRSGTVRSLIAETR